MNAVQILGPDLGALSSGISPFFHNLIIKRGEGCHLLDKMALRGCNESGKG
jgi:hypothetical protein